MQADRTVVANSGVAVIRGYAAFFIRGARKLGGFGCESVELSSSAGASPSRFATRKFKVGDALGLFND